VTGGRKPDVLPSDVPLGIRTLNPNLTVISIPNLALTLVQSPTLALTQNLTRTLPTLTLTLPCRPPAGA